MRSKKALGNPSKIASKRSINTGDNGQGSSDGRSPTDGSNAVLGVGTPRSQSPAGSKPWQAELLELLPDETYKNWGQDDAALRGLLADLMDTFGMDSANFGLSVESFSDDIGGITYSGANVSSAYKKDKELWNADDEKSVKPHMVINSIKIRKLLINSSTGDNFANAMATLRHEYQHVLDGDQLNVDTGTSKHGLLEIRGHVEAILNKLGDRRIPDLSKADALHEYSRALNYNANWSLEGSPHEEEADQLLRKAETKLRNYWQVSDDEINRARDLASGMKGL